MSYVKFLREKIMPNIKSAKKRVLIINKKTEENKSIKSNIKTLIKKFKAAVANKNVEEAENMFKEVVSAMQTATFSNVMHKNGASRRQAHFAKMLDDLKKSV